MTDTTVEGQSTRDDNRTAPGQRPSSAAERLGAPSDSDSGTTGTDNSGTDAPGNGAAGSHDNGSGTDSPPALIATDRARHYRDRWNEIKGEFVDEPRSAVRGANRLVGEILDELEELFSKQRDDIEHGLDSDDTTTEDLRQALGNYRSFFDRLLSI